MYPLVDYSSLIIRDEPDALENDNSNSLLIGIISKILSILGYDEPIINESGENETSIRIKGPHAHSFFQYKYEDSIRAVAERYADEYEKSNDIISQLTYIDILLQGPLNVAEIYTTPRYRHGIVRALLALQEGSARPGRY